MSAFSMVKVAFFCIALGIPVAACSSSDDSESAKGSQADTEPSDPSASDPSDGPTATTSQASTYCPASHYGWSCRYRTANCGYRSTQWWYWCGVVNGVCYCNHTVATGACGAVCG